MYLEVYKLLKSYNLKISEDYIKNKLETHPYYPSLLSIKDVLEELNIVVNVFKIQQEDLADLKQPLLIQSGLKGSENVFFFDNTSSNLKSLVWLSGLIFSGIVITIDQRDLELHNTENNNNLHQEGNRKIIKWLLLSSILALFCVFISLNSFAINESFYLFSCILGFVLSFFIIEKELGISNSVSDMICKLAKKVGCEKVLQSKGAKIFKWLSWGDAGIIYFFTSIVYSLICFISDTLLLAPLYIISIVVLAFPFYSLYYQIKILRQFCALCIGVLVIIVINAIVSLLVINNFKNAYNQLTTNSIVIITILFVIITTVWLLLKEILSTNSKNHKYYTLYRRLKRNPRIFLSVLDWQPLTKECLIKPDEQITFGSKDAKFNLFIACNPFCDPCALAHQYVHQLQSKFPQQVRVGIRFTLTEDNVKNKDAKFNVAKHIMQYTTQHPTETKDILHSWYSEMSFAKLANQYPLAKPIPNVDNALQEFVKWNTHLSIKGTPTFWLNGKEIPSIFNWIDLFEQLPIIIEDEADI